MTIELLKNKDFKSILHSEELFRSFISYTVRKWNSKYEPDENIELFRLDLVKAWSIRKDYYRNWPKRKDTKKL